ncbi:spermatogenesis-associated protein 31D1-like [Apodemus sylvaticus]|uniref:spermatogenesis-associated protein 31D1-like n=1 Tax=Apodemus sylvaticus TaxID=10129 RepID=UPI0022440F56|nr:spermatogenesis-associated protein 31D1-like [Apodemus sylvaticus]
MKKVLSILNSSILTSATESWLSFGSVFVDIYPKCIFLSALGLLFLYLRYLIRKPRQVSTQTSQGIKKQQGRAQKERRASFKEFRSFHGEARERRKLQSVVQSPCGRLYDPSYFRQALCQDPSCDVCNGATVKVRRLLSWASLEDCSASASSMASTASVTETSFTFSSSLSPSPSGYQISSFSLAPSPPPPSIISTNKLLVSLEDVLLGTPQGDSLPPEPTLPSTSLPLDYPLPHPLPKSPSMAQPASQQTEGPLRLENILSLAGSHGDRFLDAALSQDACDALSEYYQQQNGAQNSSPSQLKCFANQEIPNCHSSEDFDGGQASPQFTVPENLLRILERREESQADALTLKDREGEPFSKELAVWEKKPEPAAELQNSGDSFPLGGSRALLSELCTQASCVAQVQTSRSQLEAMPTQHFWGLPYLHSESMSCITTLSHCSSMCIWFNRTTDSPALAPSSPLPLPERQPQTLTQSQSRSIQLATPQTQLQTISVPSPSSQSQVRVCGVYFQRSQETKTLLQSEIHHLEYNMMTKEPETAWDLPSVIQKSQEEICLLPSKTSLAIQSSKIQPPRSVSPRDFPLTDGFQKKFEQHLRKRLILQRWGLPQGIYKSQLWVSPDPPESSKSSYGLCSFKHEDNKGPPDTVPIQSGSPQERYSGSVSIEQKTVKAQEQTLEIIQKYICSNSKTSLDNALPSDQEISTQDHAGGLSDKPSGTSQVSQCRKKFETAPKEHLKSHVDGTKEDQVPVTGSRSGNRPLHFSSFSLLPYVGKEENEAESPSDNKDMIIRSIRRIAASDVQQTSVVLDTTILEESKAKRPSPDVPKKMVEAGPVPLGKSLNSSKIIQGPQGTKMDDKHVFVSNKVSNIIKEQLGSLQPQPTKTSNASPCKSAKEADGNPPKVESTVLAGGAPEEISGPQESQASDFSCQVFKEEKFEPESSQPIQEPEPPKEVLLVSDKLIYKPLPIHDQNPFSAPMNTAQAQPQEPWMPSHALGKGQTKDSPLPVKRLWPAKKTEELGSGVTGPETLQPSGKSYQAQDSPTPGNHGKRPIPSMPVKALSPPEHQFRKHVKHFFQWLSPDRKCKGQEALLKKDASPPSPAHDPELKGRATFPGNTVAQKAVRDFGKVQKEQPGHRHGAADTMRPRVPLSPPTKPVKTKPKKEYWVPTDPVQGRQFHPQAPFSKAPSPRFHNQAAVFVGQKRCVAEKARQLQKCEALQPRLPASHRESELRQNLLLSRAGKVPRGTPPFAVGTMLADMSRLCEQKILSQNFSGKGFVLQK